MKKLFLCLFTLGLCAANADDSAQKMNLAITNLAMAEKADEVCKLAAEIAQKCTVFKGESIDNVKVTLSESSPALPADLEKQNAVLGNFVEIQSRSAHANHMLEQLAQGIQTQLTKCDVANEFTECKIRLKKISTTDVIGEVEDRIDENNGKLFDTKQEARKAKLEGRAGSR